MEGIKAPLLSFTGDAWKKKIKLFWNQMFFFFSRKYPYPLWRAPSPLQKTHKHDLRSKHIASHRKQVTGKKYTPYSNWFNLSFERIIDIIL